MRKIYHFRVVKFALLMLVAAPAFVAISVWLILKYPGSLFSWTVALLGVLFFGGCFLLGVVMLPRLIRNSEALILTPESLTIRQVGRTAEIVLRWTEIVGFSEKYIINNHFIAVNLHRTAAAIALERNCFRKMLMKLDTRCTGSPYNIGTPTIRCDADELVRTLVQYLEAYGRTDSKADAAREQ